MKFTELYLLFRTQTISMNSIITTSVTVSNESNDFNFPPHPILRRQNGEINEDDDYKNMEYHEERINQLILRRNNQDN